MRHFRKLMLISISIAAFFSALCGVYYWGLLGPHLVLRKTTFHRLAAWEGSQPLQSLLAFQLSCTSIQKRNPDSFFSTIALSGRVADWQKICVAANQLIHPDDKAARQFFETWFEPYRVTNNYNSRGLFTGYYLPLLQGRLKPSKEYSVPVYGVPKDLVTINLGQFRPDLMGEKIVAQLKNKTLMPYPERAAIDRGALDKKAPVLLWSNDLLNVFFAQIQGSARVQLPNKRQFIIGYAGTNGQPYTAIGKVLLQNKALTQKTVSMQTIREWLINHPENMRAVLNRNASYVFFNLQKNKDPIGTENVPLTPQRSLAVDTRFIPLGAPVWLETSIPEKTSAQKEKPFHQLLITQDTGGAIRGIVRGDVYWGEGDEAAFMAGHMQSSGRYWILLPKKTPFLKS